MSSQPDSDFIALQAALAGEYSLDRELGRGGMGVVYLAREVSLARPVAIKVLPPSLGERPELREAFLREAQLAARLTHPNIVPVFGTGERAGFVYIVMAYVEGITLGERIRARGPLLPGQAARMLREVSWALAYAHAAGIVHRDVTAENILLERGSDRAIVMDFGIASAMQTAALSADGHVMGNAHYVSPEQAAGEPLDARSDLYSLGVVGFYALTGRLPFDGSTAAEVVAQHLSTDAPPIASVASGVPARLAQAVDKCLAKHPLRRYRTAEGFAEAIDLAFEHAKEIPVPLRVWIAQRERELPAVIGLVAISAIPGVALVVLSLQSWLFLPPMLFGAMIGTIPAIRRLRRLLGEGYHVDDLSNALREHQLIRAEEIAYERAQRSGAMARVMRLAMGASIGAFFVCAYFTNANTLLPTGPFDLATYMAQQNAIAGMFLSVCGMVASGVSLAGDYVRLKLSARISALSSSFWKSRFAARLARVAGAGLTPPDRPAIGMPMLTEAALGRATDHLFQALPKAARKQLSALPDVIRRLEGDAGTLRSAIAALDDQLALFERDASVHHAGALGAALESDAAARMERDAVESELRDARAQGAARLGATVAALENIRLDLLRLQMGSTGIESVTASLEAARRVNDQIADAAAAQDEVERILREVTAPQGESRLSAPGALEDSDDADTPMNGTAALLR